MEAQEFLASCSCPEYLRKAERRLAEEVERCVNYLDPSSEAKITAVVEQELIRKQASCLVWPFAQCVPSAHVGFTFLLPCSPVQVATGCDSAMQGSSHDLVAPVLQEL